MQCNKFSSWGPTDAPSILEMLLLGSGTSEVNSEKELYSNTYRYHDLSSCKNITKCPLTYSVNKLNEQIFILHSIIWRTSNLTCLHYILHEVSAEYCNYFKFTQFIHNTVSMTMVLFAQIDHLVFIPAFSYHQRSTLSQNHSHHWHQNKFVLCNYLSQGFPITFPTSNFTAFCHHLGWNGVFVLENSNNFLPSPWKLMTKTSS